MTKGILLDTHIVLWMRADPARLTEPERQVIDAAPMRYVSAVTFWSISDASTTIHVCLISRTGSICCRCSRITAANW